MSASSNLCKLRVIPRRSLMMQKVNMRKGKWKIITSLFFTFGKFDWLTQSHHERSYDNFLYSRYNASGSSMFMDMTYPDLFPSFSKKISRLILCSSRRRSSAVHGALKFSRTRRALRSFFLAAFPVSFSFHFPAPVYLRLGGPLRILINRSTARFCFFVTVAWKNGVLPHTRHKIL